MTSEVAGHGGQHRAGSTGCQSQQSLCSHGVCSTGGKREVGKQWCQGFFFCLPTPYQLPCYPGREQKNCKVRTGKGKHLLLYNQCTITLTKLLFFFQCLLQTSKIKYPNEKAIKKSIHRLNRKCYKQKNVPKTTFPADCLPPALLQAFRFFPFYLVSTSICKQASKSP